jgi:hypothetical protein
MEEKLPIITHSVASTKERGERKERVQVITPK